MCLEVLKSIWSFIDLDTDRIQGQSIRIQFSRYISRNHIQEKYIYYNINKSQARETQGSLVETFDPGSIRIHITGSNEVSGSVYVQIMELPAVRRTQPITIGQHFFYNPCPIATMQWLHIKQQQQHITIFR